MISIIIPVFNRINYTMKALECLNQLDPNQHEIIIIDNASTDETNIKLQAIHQSNFTYIRNETNDLHSKACNQGYQQARGDKIIFLNNDIKITTDLSSWTMALEPFWDECLIGITAGQLDARLNFLGRARNCDQNYSYLEGWFIAMTRQNANKLDLGNGQIWNERYPFYYNDGDLSFRARQKGLKLQILDIPIQHYGKVSANQIGVEVLYQAGRKAFLEDWGKK